MELFDTHFHYYGDIPPQEYYSGIKTPELAYLMAAGADFEESRNAMRFAEAISGSWFAAGVHPHSASNFTESIAMFHEFKDHRKLAAVGEIGLDFFYNNSARSDQYKVFENFLALALDWKLPAIVHCRDQENRFDAYNDCHVLLSNFAAAGGRFVLHCFAGTPDWAEKFLALGAFLGITGMITFPKAENIRETLKVIPDDRLLLETDSPYLAPVPYRGKTNNPGFLIKVAEKVAAERGRQVEEIASLTTANAFRFFALEKTS
ncbi:MAG: TatD family hydrolase [Victivallaceae bacterium]